MPLADLRPVNSDGVSVTRYDTGYLRNWHRPFLALTKAARRIAFE
jgi:hypothetical protein